MAFGRRHPNQDSRPERPGPDPDQVSPAPPVPSQPSAAEHEAAREAALTEPELALPPAAVLLDRPLGLRDLADERLPEPDSACSERPGIHLLLEQPFRWPEEPLECLEEGTRDLLAGFAVAYDADVALIRRPRGESGQRELPTTSRRIFLSTPANDGLVISREVRDLAELAEFDLDGLVAEILNCEIPDGWTESEPVTLIGVHGSRTRAAKGPEVAAELFAMDPENVWEASLYAGSAESVHAVTLPGNQLHGGLTARQAPQVIDAVWANRLVLENYQGRTHHSAAQQLAEATLRGRLRADSWAAVVAVSQQETSVANGAHEDATISVSRVLTRWRVYPALVGDPALARMVPARAAQPTQLWRVVIDRSQLIEAERTDEHVSVIEMADENEPGRGAHAWDTTHTDVEQDLLPDPTVVSEVGGLQPGRALDLGCGSGRHALWLAEQGWDVTAVDFSRSGLWRMADEAGRRNLGVRAELADLRVWTPGSAGYDLILVSHLHLADVFQRTAGWLSATGRVVLVNPVEGNVEDDVPRQDYVFLAARATGARLRVLRAGLVERRTESGCVQDVVIVAGRPEV